MSVVGAFMADEAGGITGENTWLLVFLSRSLNVLSGGSPRELFCARAFRNGWAMCWYIDALFRIIRADDRQHCRACYLGDKRTGRLRERAHRRNAQRLSPAH